MKAQKNPWQVCAGCTLLLFCTVGLTTSSFSVYQPYLISIVGLSNTQASMVVTVRTLFSLLGVFAVQKYIALAGLRRGLIAMNILAAVSFFIFGLADDYISCCIAAALLGLCYGLGGTVAVSIAIKRVFSSHQALALGIASAGTGLATIVWPPVATAIISALSLRHALWAEGAFLLISSLSAFVLIGPKVNKKPDSLKQADINAPRSAMEKRSLVLICAAAFLIGTMGNTGWNHLSVLYSTEGADAITVSRLISFVGLALTAGKILFGQAVDRFGGKRASVGFCAILIAGEILACFAGLLSMPLALLSMLCMGLGLPISTVGFTSMANDLSTPGHFPSTLRYFQVSYMVGSFVSGPVPGMIADHCGSYVPAYYILSAFAFMNLALVWAAYKFGRKD